MNAPIILFVYNRYEHTKKTIEALQKNELANESKLYIFVDYIEDETARIKAQALYDFLDLADWKLSFLSVQIRYSMEHKGLAGSVISGVTEIINKYDKVIVLEDDIVTVPLFLRFMNSCLNYYESNASIWSISGYAIPDQRLMNCSEKLYLSCRADSWGWATWKDRWNTIDWMISDYKSFEYNVFKRLRFNKGGADLAFMLDMQMRGDIDSWAVRWCYNQNCQKKYTVYPVESYVDNIGFDGTGTHFTSASEHPRALLAEKMTDPHDLKPSKVLMKYYYQYNSGSLYCCIKRMVVALLYNLGLYKLK